MDAQTDGGEAKPAQKVKDPLRWFGVLVPSQLRQAQKDFKAGIGGHPHVHVVRLVYQPMTQFRM